MISVPSDFAGAHVLLLCQMLHPTRSVYLAGVMAARLREGRHVGLSGICALCGFRPPSQSSCVYDGSEEPAPPLQHTLSVLTNWSHGPPAAMPHHCSSAAKVFSHLFTGRKHCLWLSIRTNPFSAWYLLAWLQRKNQKSALGAVPFKKICSCPLVSSGDWFQEPLWIFPDFPVLKSLCKLA